MKPIPLLLFHQCLNRYVELDLANGEMKFPLSGLFYNCCEKHTQWKLLFGFVF